MASNFHLVILLVLVSISVTSGYTLSTRDAVLKFAEEKHKSNKVGSLDVLPLVGIIILAVIVTSVIIAFLYNLYHVLKTKNTQSIGQGEVGAKEMGHETDEKMDTVTMSPQAVKRSNGDANV